MFEHFPCWKIFIFLFVVFVRNSAAFSLSHSSFLNSPFLVEYIFMFYSHCAHCTTPLHTDKTCENRALHNISRKKRSTYIRIDELVLFVWNRMQMCAKNALHVGFLRGVTHTSRGKKRVETNGEYFTHIVPMGYVGTTTIKLGLLLKQSKQWKIQPKFCRAKSKKVWDRSSESGETHDTRINH